MNLRIDGFVFILAGVIMLIITLVQWLKILSFKNCNIISAEVTDTKKSTSYSDNHRRTSYSLRVTYNVDGIDYERNVACDSASYNQGTGRQVEIRYKSRNPKRIILNDIASENRAVKILWIVTLALLVIGGVMILISFR